MALGLRFRVLYKLRIRSTGDLIQYGCDQGVRGGWQPYRQPVPTCLAPAVLQVADGRPANGLA